MIINRKKSFKTRGFTLVELLVTISIMIVVMNVVLFNQNDFNRSVDFTNRITEVVNNIREARISALGVYSADGAEAYGVHFERGGEEYRFISYVINEDGNLDEVVGATREVSLELGPRLGSINIESISNNGLPENEIYIIFKRPNPQAIIITSEPFSLNGIDCESVNCLENVEIVFKLEDVEKKIIINNQGQISTQGI